MNKIPIALVFLTFLPGYTFQNENRSLTEEDMNHLQKKFKIENLIFNRNQNNNDIFSESLSNCLSTKDKFNIQLKNTYTINFKNNIISNISEYQIKEKETISSINEITNTFLTAPRANFSNLCWQDGYTKPIYSKKIGNTLLVFSSNENYKFNSKNDSIKSTIENSPQNYLFDEIILIMDNFKNKQ